MYNNQRLILSSLHWFLCFTFMSVCYIHPSSPFVSVDKQLQDKSCQFLTQFCGEKSIFSTPELNLSLSVSQTFVRVTGCNTALHNKICSTWWDLFAGVMSQCYCLFLWLSSSVYIWKVVVMERLTPIGIKKKICISLKAPPKNMTWKIIIKTHLCGSTRWYTAGVMLIC